MSVSKRDLVDLTSKMQMDLRALQAKLVEIRSWIANLETADTDLRCPDCTLTLGGPLRLAEHRYLSHAGPEPEHWRQAETRALPVQKDTTDRSVGPTSEGRNA